MVSKRTCGLVLFAVILAANLSVTAGGLVFCSGTLDNKIRAFDKTDGRQLWEAELPWDGSGPPAVYQIDGRQYVVIPATGVMHLDTKRGDAWVAFALPNKP